MTFNKNCIKKKSKFNSSQKNSNIQKLNVAENDVFDIVTEKVSKKIILPPDVSIQHTCINIFEKKFGKRNFCGIITKYWLVP